MNNEQGIYTINNMYYDTGLSTDKRCSTDIPMTKIAVPSDEETTTCKILSTRYGKLGFAVDAFIAVLVIIILLLIELDVIPHRHSGFYCKDLKLSFKYDGETVGTVSLLLIVYLTPLIIIAAVEKKSYKKVGGELYQRVWCWYKKFLLGATSLLVIIQFTKIVTGEHRPHFLHTCQPSYSQNCSENEYVSKYVCTNTRDKTWFVADASRSFPSGHTALSVFTAFFCAWYLERCLPRMMCKLVKPLAQVILLLACTFCSISRITDNRHHWWDVLAGSIFGFAFFIYITFVLCHNFKRSFPLSARPSHSTVTLLTDTTNKNAASVIL